MSATQPDALIAGAGWRVSRFIVPALLNAGLTPNDVTILRRTSSAPTPAIPGGIRVVTSLDQLRGLDFRMTVNCVTAESMLGLQRHLIQKYPAAIHFCDTPAWTEGDHWYDVLKVFRARVFSLEDWPLMPNLSFLVEQTHVTRVAFDFRVDHFGVLGHFLSLYRLVHGDRSPFGRELSMRGSDLIGRPRPGSTVTFRSPKNLAVAKTSLRTDTAMIEDFHEVAPAAHSNDEVLYRLVDENSVRYLRGVEEVSAHRVDSSILRTFHPLDDRKNVHELDKFIGLTQLFRAVLNGRHFVAYPYLGSARDALTARRLSRRHPRRLI